MIRVFYRFGGKREIDLNFFEREKSKSSRCREVFWYVCVWIGYGWFNYWVLNS